MRVYVAAPWKRKQDAITSRWFEHPGDPNDCAGLTESVDEVRAQAAEDIYDVLSAEALVVLNLQQSEGKAVETGIALMAQIPVISVGPRSNIFQTLGTEVATVEEAIQVLDGIS